MLSRFVLFLGTFSIILLLIDLYGFMGIRQLTANMEVSTRKIYRWLWWIPTIITFILYIFLIIKIQDIRETRSYGFLSFVQALTFVFVIPKLIFVVFHFLNDLGWLGQWTAAKVKESITSEPYERINRLQFFNQLGLAAGVLMMGAITYGVTRGKYAFRILSEKINFPNLPKEFDGTRIVQISDAHLGSFPEGSEEEIQEAIDMINDLKPDYIFFTGDMVNNYAFEAEPWIGHFNALKANKGKFSILGNHDYGDYGFDKNNPEDAIKKAEHFERLVAIHQEMGFKLLRNENVLLESNGAAIRLLGMENWGKGFQQYGDFSKTMDGAIDEEFKILLSHDPTHWEEQVMGKARVDLTLSGHTHGMQFGVELPKLGIKFSPASLRYKRWGGLYSEGNQHLYINRGFGFLGFPGRVGMPPEITCIDIYSA